MSGSALFPLLIVGQGRAGSALRAALEGSGGGEVLTWSRGEGRESLESRLARAATLVLAVSDEALERSLAEHVLPAWPQQGSRPTRALHLAGAWSSKRLEALAERGVSVGVFHPVVALAGAESARSFAGAGATISGDDAALEACRMLAGRLGMQVNEVEDEKRPLLHLGAVMAAGDLVGLLHLAEEVVMRAGLEGPAARALVAELGRSALEGYASRGAAEALTGPVPRADLQTLSRHTEAAREASLESPHRAAHALLAQAGAALLESEGRLDRDAADAIRALLNELPD